MEEKKDEDKPVEQPKEEEKKADDKPVEQPKVEEKKFIAIE